MTILTRIRLIWLKLNIVDMMVLKQVLTLLNLVKQIQYIENNGHNILELPKYQTKNKNKNTNDHNNKMLKKTPLCARIDIAYVFFVLFAVQNIVLIISILLVSIGLIIVAPNMQDEDCNKSGLTFFFGVSNVAASPTVENEIALYILTCVLVMCNTV